MKQSLIIVAIIFFSGYAAMAQFPPPPPSADSVQHDKIIFTKVDVEASFSGGEAAWRQFLMKNLRADRVIGHIKFPRGQKELKQTVIVKFIVAMDGSLHDISAENNDVNPYCIAEAIRVIKVSPTWIPAQQNGRVVNAYRRQPITFLFER